MEAGLLASGELLKHLGNLLPGAKMTPIFQAKKYTKTSRPSPTKIRGPIWVPGNGNGVHPQPPPKMPPIHRRLHPGRSR